MRIWTLAKTATTTQVQKRMKMGKSTGKVHLIIDNTSKDEAFIGMGFIYVPSFKNLGIS